MTLQPEVVSNTDIEAGWEESESGGLASRGDVFRGQLLDGDGATASRDVAGYTVRFADDLDTGVFRCNTVV